MTVIRDKDLISMQEARELLSRANQAWQTFKTYSQERVDHIISAMAESGRNHSRRLAEMAVEETGIGIVADKTIKNQFAAQHVYNSIRSQKTIGVLRTDPDRLITEIAMPVGIICGIIPTTNPTSTVIYKSLIALKSGNSIVFTPHPTALNSICAAANVMHEAAVAAGAPRNIIGCLHTPTIPGSRELMTHPLTAMILATGGSDMVRSAYSSGKPALGVGPGNVPAYIHQSASIVEAVGKIIQSKTFDNGTVCSSEQSIIADRIIARQVISELEKQGAYFLPEEQVRTLESVLFSPQGMISPKLVGRSAVVIAQSAGLRVPDHTRLLVVRPKGIGPEFPLSREKLCPVIGFYESDGPEDACMLCLKLLALGGVGHSLVIHATDESIIEEFAMQKPVSRLLVNTPSTHGAIGYSSGLTPSLTLGCGTIGGNATSDNITATHLINIKRVARHLTQSAYPTETPVNPPVEPRSQISIEHIRNLVEDALRTTTNPPQSNTGY